MSTELGCINSIGHPDSPQSLKITRFYGGDKNGCCIQLSIGDKFSMLDKKGIKKLRKLLKNYVR